MNHRDHVSLLEKAIPRDSGGVWADFGSGEGAFTLALRDIAGRDVEIYSVDTNSNSLMQQQQAFQNLFPESNIHHITGDFISKLSLPPLDGFIAANSIHYHKDHVTILKKLTKYLKPHGKIIIVEYNTDHGNAWVPHPFSFETLKRISKEAGLSDPKLLATISSRFLNEIYSAVIYSQ